MGEIELISDKIGEVHYTGCSYCGEWAPCIVLEIKLFTKEVFTGELLTEKESSNICQRCLFSALEKLFLVRFNSQDEKIAFGDIEEISEYENKFNELFMELTKVLLKFLKDMEINGRAKE